MSFPNKLSFENIESRWNQRWVEKELFKKKKKAGNAPFTIVMPPPNITGKLHLGHVLNLSVQDVAIRFHKMKGRDTWWIPGLDHAAIATEAKVVKMLQEKGIAKKDLTREQFLAHAWKWKDQYGALILEQMKRLGIAVDFSYTPFTLDDTPSASVREAFVRLYKKGLIYRSRQMIHWDPKAQSALSDEEVVYKEVAGNLYYISYPLVGAPNEQLTVATTRPETILGDTAVAVHPADPRYRSYVGKKLHLPLTNRQIPVIADPYVQLDLGSGALKVTPAHDPNDYALGKKHGLEVIDILTGDGKINEKGGAYSGLTREEARQAIVKDLDKKGYLKQVVPHTHQVGFSERTHVRIEPRLSVQWFLKMKQLAQPALQAVEDGTIELMPKHLKTTYRRWLEDIHDWCISRQLWWGHRIPAYYLPNGTYVVATSKEKALAAARQQPDLPNLTVDQLTEESDVLDTWFSAWLWPISILNGLLEPKNQWMQRHYPSNLLVTGSDILFFWVARMVMAGYAFTGKPPFKQVYFTGLVRDKRRRKMSKSLGNSPDTFELMDKYGVDGVRFAVLLASPAGNDLLFDEKLCVQGAQFVHKLWHAARLLSNAPIDPKRALDKDMALLSAWWCAEFRELTRDVTTYLETHRYADALMLLYKTTKETFCGQYLECMKGASETGWSAEAHKRSAVYLYQLCQLLHPFLPFITEEVAHRLAPYAGDEPSFLVRNSWPSAPQQPEDAALRQDAAHAFQLIRRLRHAKATHNCQVDRLYVASSTTYPHWLFTWKYWIQRIAQVEDFVLLPAFSDKQYRFLVDRFHFSLDKKSINTTKEGVDTLKKNLHSKQLFLKKIQSKLKNKAFLTNAPAALVARERQKEKDTIAHINTLREQLTAGV